jgi:hypothetical protein
LRKERRRHSGSKNHGIFARYSPRFSGKVTGRTQTHESSGEEELRSQVPDLVGAFDTRTIKSVTAGWCLRCAGFNTTSFHAYLIWTIG